MSGELAKWVRKRLHHASCIDDFVVSLREFIKVLRRPREGEGFVLKLNVIRDWKAPRETMPCFLTAPSPNKCKRQGSL
jgi:hypothetical protein